MSQKATIELRVLHAGLMYSTTLRYDLTDTAPIAFMFNGGQSPASILSPICTL